MAKDYEALDFFRDEGLVDDPYPYFEAMRGRCPVHREPHHDVMMVTGYDEALAVYNDTDTYSSCVSVTGPFPGFPVPLEGDDVSALIEEHRDKLPMSDQLPTLDPPTHTDHRALLMRLITPKRLKENEASMWRLADGLLDEFLAGERGEFIGGFAAPFTRVVIADLLGVPDEDHEDFADALQGRPRSGNTVGNTGSETLAHSPLEFLYDRFSRYITDRRREPREDVLTSLARATFPDGSTPEVMDVVRVAANLFSAGQETTVRLLGSAMVLLGDDPELQRQLRAERDRVPNFIEETLRIESPIKGDFRLAKKPTTLGGVAVPAGTTLMVVNAAVNRDPRQFTEPATFDLGRANARRHVSFGRGVHSCPGAPLARAEARVAIERLLDRTADIRLSAAAHGPAGARRFDYVPTFILRGVTSLELEWTHAEGTTR
ncbi:cytochrome P450 [Actinophytocola oryzae]|uniref:Cytochrome P450 n=1 Tax=Actinophytocola oryzae TaxID=502181 RepID=A0A4R7VKZ5_9PSEU|nr:cytochrome P450 [Actinophytocola oryzae]TDV49849.1 cytochrome P450 [Actinophytocola oryzae]